MILLTRSVRFSIHIDQATAAKALALKRHNSYGGWPTICGFGLQQELEVGCCGEPDARTGYLVNIARVDEAVREKIVARIQQTVLHKPGTQPVTMLGLMLDDLRSRLGEMVQHVRWRLTPYHAIIMRHAQRNEAILTQQFDFSAAHRLHCETLSAEENRAIFGKCNNPNGHGHNYRVEVSVVVAAQVEGEGEVLHLTEVERIVDERILNRFDHKHLNVDTPEFAQMNPTVENIARVCHGLLEEPIRRSGGRLAGVTVWETEKTSATYPA